MANVVPMSATAIRTEKREYEKYTAKINAEKKKQSTLRKKANKLLDAREAAVKKQQAAEPAKYKTIIKKGKKISTKINNVTGMTSAQKTAYLNSTKVGKAINISKKKQRGYEAKRRKYDKYKQNTINMHRANSIIHAKRKVKHTRTINSYIMPNDARSNNSFVAFMVTNEADDHSTNVATEPVEHGVNIQTSTQMNAPTVSVTAKIYGKNMESLKEQVNKLTNWSHSGADMFFNGPHQHPQCTISDVSATYNWDADGSLTTADLSITLSIAQFFNTEPRSKRKGAKKDSGSKGRKRGQSSKNANSKHYVIAKSGMTYAYIADKKHVSVQSLEQKNNFSATKIPIGSKIYY